MARRPKLSLTEFSVKHPLWVVAFIVLVTVPALIQFPKAKTDTNPKNMLPKTSDVRVWNDEVDKTFGLYEDMIVLGIANDRGILNPQTLEKIERITANLLKLDGVAARDVSSFTTIDNVTSEGGMLRVNPLMSETPKNDRELQDLRRDLFDNPLFINRIISPDGKTTAIYVPLEKGANGKLVADRIREIVRREKGDEKYYVAGDPVARDTFGAEMFKLMAIFAPIAGMVMFAARYLMFRDLFLSIALMMDAMIAIIWSMGLLIGLGIPIHIMSSMAPVFLMAIATDSIHIFNEFYFRFREKKDRKTAILETMEVVGRPVKYTALATAAAFAVLVFMNIIPVRIFGALIALGTILLRVLSFSFIPAMFTFVKEKNVEKASRGEDIALGRTSRFLKNLASLGAHNPRKVIFVGLLLLVVAVIGMSRIVVNNNMVEWFKKGSDVRVADRALNDALGGTSLAYVVAISEEDDFIKNPEAMRTIEGLQRHLETLLVVGKTFSVADYVKRINRVLHQNDPSYDAIPDSKETIGQYLFLFSMSAKPSDLDNVVDYPFRRANIWVQLKTWDADAMRKVIQATEEYKSRHPTSLVFRPAGIAYFNLIWNNEVLWDMVKGFILALVVVFVILALNFRSIKWAVVGYIPLVFTVMLIYGFIGFTGKNFDMPISVLSCLSLGMAVDFAIHFVSRLKSRLCEVQAGDPGLTGARGHTEAQGHAGVRAHTEDQGHTETPGPAQSHGMERFVRDESKLVEALLWTAARPGKGILRNAILFASAFSVMLLAPLTPYITVGAFIVSMMTLSALMTIICLPALIVLLRRWLFGGVH